jgi:tetratricopeptide (TPR) repeat protein
LVFVYRETGRHYLISIVLFALGLLAKVSIVPLPFVLLLTDWLQGRPIDRTCLREKIPYFLLAVLFLGIALYGKSKQASFPTVSLFLSFVSIPLYLKNFFWPSGLSIFYPFTEELSLTQPQILGGLLLIIGLSIAAWWSLRRTRVLAFGWVFFLLLLVPSFVNVVKGGAHGFYDLYIGSDRYAYLASIGILVPLGSLLSTRWLTVLLPIILVLAVATFRQSLTWHSSEALFAQVIRHHENSHVAYNNLGGILAKNRKYTEASQLFEKSLAIKKTSKSLYNIGQVYTALQQYPEAIAAYQQLVTLDPRHAHGHAKLGGLLLMLGNVPEAFENLQRAEELDKQIPSVYYNLGLINEKLGQQEEARRSFERVLELDQRDPQALQKLGR